MSITIIKDLKYSFDAQQSYIVDVFNKKIQTLATHCQEEVDAWISHVLQVNHMRKHELIVGFDTEFHLVKPYPAVLLQFCVGRDCLLFQLCHSPNVPQSLVDFFKTPEFTFVGVEIQQDIKKLRDWNISVGHGVDARDVAAEKMDLKNIKNMGLKRLAWEVLKLQIDKPREVTMSEWYLKNLTYDQVQYACVDAFISRMTRCNIHFHSSLAFEKPKF